MSKSFAFATVLFAAGAFAGSALATDVIDAPGRGYREQRDRVYPPMYPIPPETNGIQFFLYPPATPSFRIETGLRPEMSPFFRYLLDAMDRGAVPFSLKSETPWMSRALTGSIDFFDAPLRFIPPEFMHGVSGPDPFPNLRLGAPLPSTPPREKTVKPNEKSPPGK
jgi:hypothetical protein